MFAISLDGIAMLAERHCLDIHSYLTVSPGANITPSDDQPKQLHCGVGLFLKTHRNSYILRAAVFMKSYQFVFTNISLDEENMPSNRAGYCCVILIIDLHRKDEKKLHLIKTEHFESVWTTEAH